MAVKNANPHTYLKGVKMDISAANWSEKDNADSAIGGASGDTPSGVIRCITLGGDFAAGPIDLRAANINISVGVSGDLAGVSSAFSIVQPSLNHPAQHRGASQ